MARKSPPIAFITRLIRTTSRPELIALLDNSPLRTNDKAMLLDYADGMSYKEIGEKYHKSTARVYQWKRSTYEQLHYFIVQKL